nr:PREDICTED: tyrosine-protein phosphatase Lar-like isoform X7 [Tribolium castaneum]|eukprot:XP_015839780.1 PREDICTED: tyrosine-protein phosphatase Lar-like isoform X7 [Tribolium castaneum]
MTVSYEKIIGPTLILLICNVCSHCQVFFKETHPNQKLLLSTTKIAVPDEVQDLRAINHSDTSIHLIWKQPLQMNGDFIYYVVEYQIVSDVACKGNKVSKKFKLKTRETSINVQKLVPYANYFFKVFAVNTKSHGKLRAVYHSTRGSPLLKNEECPKLKNIITNDHHVEIRFSFIDCEKIKGPVSIKITAICAEVWCKNVTKEFKYNAEQNSFTLHRLFPFVKYNLTAKCCRNKQCYTIVKNQIFKIGAQSPGPVTNLSVFAKNDNSISIRWRKPHPPNGILDHYNISYFTTKESEAKSEIVMNSPCTLWTNFHCYTLNHLKADKKYFVQVRAKNIEPQTYGQLVEINAVTKIEASKPPLNLTVKWTLQNDLQLIWCHPIEANGYITHFNISVFSENQTENHIIHTLEVLNYSFTYIHIGYNMPRAYIATQGPKISTVDDFWRMIWQEIVQHIVMLANIYEQGKKKVEKYWPNPHEVLHYGKIKIQHFNIKVSTDFEHRIIKVTNQNITRDVHQYLFLSWQYLEVPFYSQSFITLLEKLQSIPLSTESPIVVHSSAGVGRTGTIILCDICLRMAAEENSVDIFGTLYQLRDQRPNLVKNVEQFKLAHLVILDYLVGRRTGTPCSKIEKTKNFLKSEELNTQLNYLKNIAWWDEMALHHLLSAIPAKIFNQFITIQQPECNMVGKFWKLVHEKEILLIVSLNNSKIWSFQETNLLNPVDYLMLKYIKTKSYKFYDIIILHMYIRDIKEYRVVEIVSVKEWPAKKLCPKNIVNFLSFWEKTYEKFKKSNQVLITCFDGVAACGLYIAMTFVLEKIKLEHICDVCQGVRVVRCINSEFVTSEKQLAFMYKAAMIYVNKFQLYSNFK